MAIGNRGRTAPKRAALGVQLRRAAFTLTELVVTTTVLLVVAALVVPNMAHLRDSQLARDVVPSIQRLVSYAREAAISQQATAVLAYDPSTRTLTVKQDTTSDPNAPTTSAISAGQAGGSSALPSPSGSPSVMMPTTAPPDPNNPKIDRSVVVPANLELTSFQVAGKEASESDFQVRFYSDGTSDGGGLGYTLNSSTQSIVIDGFGHSAFVDGALPDPSTQKWEAGQFEPRSNATP